MSSDTLVLVLSLLLIVLCLTTLGVIVIPHVLGHFQNRRMRKKMLHRQRAFKGLLFEDLWKQEGASDNPLRGRIKPSNFS